MNSQEKIKKRNPFILYGSAVVLSTLSIAGAVLVFSSHESLMAAFPGMLIPLLAVFFEGLCIGFIVQRYRQTDELTELKKLHKEHTVLIKELQKKYDKAEKEIKARDEFLSIASHELKTPLTSMLLQIQTALHNIRNVSLAHFSVENLMKMLDNVEQQSKRLSKMINDLLNVSLITTGRLTLEFEEVDLAQVLKNSVNQFSEKFKNEGYVVYLQTDDHIIGKWDRLRIEQVISNLITNAIKYGNKKPVTITATKQRSMAKLIVKDRGIGIPSEKIDKVFNRFERAETSPNYKGLGIGLYITQQIIAAHGGKITIESKVNSGTTLTIELPLKPPPKSLLSKNPPSKN